MVSQWDLERAGSWISVSSGEESGIWNLPPEERFGENRSGLTCVSQSPFYLVGMINKSIRLAVLGLVVGLASAQIAGAQCSSCHDDDSGGKKKKSSETNNVTPPNKK